MEYVQERITTLHDFGETEPEPAVDPGRAAIVLPMTEQEHGSPATVRIRRTLEDLTPGRVVVPLRTAPESAATVRDWLAEFDLPLTVLPSEGPALTAHLEDGSIDAPPGKGRDVWLGLGVAAADHDLVICHDADTASNTRPFVPRLLAPLEQGFQFSKGYYARVEEGRLYGRLFRLFYVPLVRSLADANEAPILQYLSAFRYALAGEFGMTADLARSLRVEPRWGLEVGTLGDAFSTAGMAGTAQVDLGQYRHDHRSVAGPGGLATMAKDVAAALFRVVESHGVDPNYEVLPDAYRAVAEGLVDQYAVDAAFNGLEYDPATEREQVRTYAAAIDPPGVDDRLPAWRDCPLDPEAVLAAARDDLAAPSGPSAAGN